MQIRVIKLIILEQCAAVRSNCLSVIKIVNKREYIEEQIKTLLGLRNFIAQNL